jgi:hypothetical protein
MTVRRTVALAAALLAGALATATSAQASQHEVGSFSNRSCGEAYLETAFVVASGGPDRLKLVVRHVPGAFGTIQVRSLSEPDRGVVWSFAQPALWIIGEYTIDSPPLPIGDYHVQVWSHNVAQLREFCHWTLYQWDAVHRH